MPYKKIFIGISLTFGGLVVLMIIVIIVTLPDEESYIDQAYTHTLPDDQYDFIAGRLTSRAKQSNWCYKFDGSLDSRDSYILVVFAEQIAQELSGKSVLVEDDKLTAALLDRGWTTLYSGGKDRYRPPGCGT